MDERERELLSAVIESPHDDAARRVYADYLMERGDPRGELIHIDLLLAHDPTSELEGRRDELLETHLDAWSEQLGIRPGASGRWHRGFLHMLGGSPEALCDSRAAFDNAPIEELEIDLQPDTDPDAVAELVAIPGLARIHTLTVGGRIDLERPPVHAIRTLASSSHLTALRVLAIEEGVLDDAGAASLARSSFIANLDVLLLASSTLTHEGLVPLVAGAQLLRKLRLVGSPLGRDGVMAMLDVVAKLRELTLHGCELGREGVLALCAHPAIATLDTLSLAREPLAGLVRTMVTLPTWPSLRTLSLTGGRLTSTDARALPAMEASRLEELGLDWNSIGDDGVIALGATKLPALRVLGLRGNPIGPAGVMALAQSVGLPALTWLRCDVEDASSMFSHRPGVHVS